MGYSGLIYAAIVAAWAAFLVPRWVRRNEEVEHARETDTVRGVRVLQRRAGPPQAPHRPAPDVPVYAPIGTWSAAPATPDPSHAGRSSTLFTSQPPAARPRPGEVERASRGGGSSPPSDRAQVTAGLGALRDAFATAARRRRRMLVVLVLAVAVAAAGVYLGRLPGWVLLVPAVLTVLFLFVARRAAVVQAGRRWRLVERHRAAARRRAGAAPVQGADDHAVVAEEMDDETAEPVARRLVIPETAADVDDPDSWQPVPVPLPTYLTKPKAPRRARRIDLSQPGAWTSGRLDPASSIELPRRDPVAPPAAAVDTRIEAEEDAEIEEQAEHRRAVGD